MRTLVYGMGESGKAACGLLMDAGEEIIAADAGDTPAIRRSFEELGVKGYAGASATVLEGVDRVVASPGVPPRDAVLTGARDRGIPVISEVSLGLSMLEGYGVRVAAVTGTNGKTTVAGMVDAVLAAAGIPHVTAGNSWRALCGCVAEVREAGTLVLELSSFQLHYLPEGKLDVGALLNVRPDHLNWHSSFEEYTEDKLRIFELVGEGGLALASARDPVGRRALERLGLETILVGDGDTGVYEGRLWLEGEVLLGTENLPFSGDHNYENALFAAAMARRLGASSEAMGEGLRGYRIASHRLEEVGRRGGVVYVDDSKATNPAAVYAALGSFDAPVVLILGGSEKHTDFTELDSVLGRPRAVIAQGEAGPRLFEHAASAGAAAHLARDLKEAVELAKRIAEPGDVVLLSPGCASFDQFSGYGERGEAFARYVKEER